MLGLVIGVGVGLKMDGTVYPCPGSGPYTSSVWRLIAWLLMAYVVSKKGTHYKQEKWCNSTREIAKAGKNRNKYVNK